MTAATICDQCGEIARGRPDDWVLVVRRSGSFDFCSEDCAAEYLQEVEAAEDVPFVIPVGFQRYDFGSGVMQIKRARSWRYWATLSGQKCSHEHREYLAARKCRQKMVRQSQKVC